MKRQIEIIFGYLGLIFCAIVVFLPPENFTVEPLRVYFAGAVILAFSMVHVIGIRGD